MIEEGQNLFWFIKAIMLFEINSVTIKYIFHDTLHFTQPVQHLECYWASSKGQINYTTTVHVSFSTGDIFCLIEENN